MNIKWTMGLVGIVLVSVLGGTALGKMTPAEKKERMKERMEHKKERMKERMERKEERMEQRMEKKEKKMEEHLEQK